MVNKRTCAPCTDSVHTLFYISTFKIDEMCIRDRNEGEDRILVKSPKVATYDLKPEMSAYEVSDKLVDAIKRCV